MSNDVTNARQLACDTEFAGWAQRIAASLKRVDEHITSLASPTPSAAVRDLEVIRFALQRGADAMVSRRH